MRKLLSHNFSKSQYAALIATGCDFFCLIILVEFFSIWYVPATTFAALLGAIVNFILGRYWCFKANEQHWPNQAMRYFWVALGSLFLNTMGVFLITELLVTQYLLSKILVSIIIGFAFNYPLHRFYVFKTQTAT